MPSKYSFSTQEIKEISISLAVLSVVFAYPDFISTPAAILISFFVLGIAFIGHELAHKFVARNMGFWSEYKMWTQGLLLAVVFAVATGGRMIFAAPGAVYFSGTFFKRPTKEQVGKIGLAGPVVNMVFMGVFAAAFLLTGNSVLYFAASINAWLAIFNLIPFGPLDGAKVFGWDWRIWLVAMAIPIAGFALLMLI